MTQRIRSVFPRRRADSALTHRITALPFLFAALALLAVLFVSAPPAQAQDEEQVITRLAVAPDLTTAAVKWRNTTTYVDVGDTRQKRRQFISWKPVSREGPTISYEITPGSRRARVEISQLRLATTYILTVHDLASGSEVSVQFTTKGAITDLAVAPAATTAVVTWKNITPYQEGVTRPWRGHYISWKPTGKEGPIGDALYNLTIKGAPEEGASGRTKISWDLKPGTTYDLTVSDRYVHSYDPASSGGEATVRFTTASTEMAEPEPFKFIVLVHRKNQQGESKEERVLKVDRPFDANTMAYTAKAPPRFTHAAIAHNPGLYDVTLTSNREVESDRTHVPLKKGINVITAAVTPKGSQESQTYTITILRPANGNGSAKIKVPRNVTSSIQENGDLLITWDDPANINDDDVNVTAWLVQWRPKGVKGNDWSSEPFFLAHPKGDDNRFTVARENRIATDNPDVEFRARVRAYDSKAKRLGPGASSP